MEALLNEIRTSRIAIQNQHAERLEAAVQQIREVVQEIRVEVNNIREMVPKVTALPST